MGSHPGRREENIVAKIIQITIENDGQRIDNFIFKQLKGIPKGRVYRAIREGEVRVNKKRVKPSYHLQGNDEVRIPPLTAAIPPAVQPPKPEFAQSLLRRIIYEDSGLLVIAKPPGLPVHGGSGIRGGVIELLRLMRSDLSYLELVHRLDKETSGCLLLAKKRRTLLTWHQHLVKREVRKQYLTLVKGQWQGGARQVDAPLRKNILQSGERLVKVTPEGKPAKTLFRPLAVFADMSLLEAFPITGRTHQIRVHLASIGYPIAGDEKYGQADFNKLVKTLGLKRLFLHAASISLSNTVEPQDQDFAGICVMLEPDLYSFLNKIIKQNQS